MNIDTLKVLSINENLSSFELESIYNYVVNIDDEYRYYILRNIVLHKNVSLDILINLIDRFPLFNENTKNYYKNSEDCNNNLLEKICLHIYKEEIQERLIVKNIDLRCVCFKISSNKDNALYLSAIFINHLIENYIQNLYYERIVHFKNISTENIKKIIRHAKDVNSKARFHKEKINESFIKNLETSIYLKERSEFRKSLLLKNLSKNEIEKELSFFDKTYYI